MKKIIATSLLLFLNWACYAQRIPVPKQDISASTNLANDFKIFDPHYLEKKELRVNKIRALAKQVFALEAGGRQTACSHQILFELISMIASSADFAVIDQRITDLQQSLNINFNQARADSLNPADGSYGACYQEWFLKVNKSYDYLEKTAAKNAAPEPLPAFLNRVNTPQKLDSYLSAIAVSDVRKTGIDHEREFNDMLSTLTQMIIRGRPLNYSADSLLRAELLDLILNKLRNPATGWWGEAYLRDGKTDFIDNLSITFHIVSYLNGRVPHMDKVIAMALAVKQLDYPVGWLWQKQYWNHNNMDVVTLFKYGWTAASARQRTEMRAEIQKMLNWCLHRSLRPDGSFMAQIQDGSVEEAEAYGVDFLDRIGYFDKAKRFWTTRSFREAEGIRQKILTFVKKHAARGGAGGDDYKDIMEELSKKQGG